MNRIEIVRLLKLSIIEQYRWDHRMFFEVSISKKPSIIPVGWSEKYHLDCVLLEKQRGSSSNPFQTHCIEIKSCKADFKSDTKWQNYVGRTDMLSFLALPGVIDPKDLPNGIGLIVPQISRYTAYLTHFEFIKKSKLQEVSIEARYDIMYGLAINMRRYDRNYYTEEIGEEHKKLAEKHLKKIRR